MTATSSHQNSPLAKLTGSPLHSFPIPLCDPDDGSPLRFEDGGFRSTARSIDVFRGQIPILLPSSSSQNPLLNHYQRDAELFDYFEPRHGATAHDERRVHEFILHHIPQGISTVVDIGCGGAWLAKALCPRGVNVVSLDVSIRNVATALDQVSSSHHFGLVADAFRLPVPDHSLNCIVASEVIEHLSDPKRFVQSLLKKLSHKGVLIITTPYQERIQYYLCIHCNEKTPANGHLHSFSEDNLFPLFKDPHFASESTLDLISETFGNKLLIFLRTYPVLSPLPYRVWRLIDRFANLFFPKPIHIGLIAKKTLHHP